MIYQKAGLAAGSTQGAEAANLPPVALHALPDSVEGDGSQTTFSSPNNHHNAQSTQSGTLSLVYSSKKGVESPHIGEETHHVAHHKSIIMRDTFFTQSVLTLTTGVFITGFALKLHAPESIIGLLVAIPALAQLLQLPSVALVARSASLKKLLIQSTLLSRLFLVPLIAIPFFPASQWSIASLVVFYSLYAAFAAISTCSWNTWVKETIDHAELGNFFAKKLALGSLITLALTFFGGLFIDCGAELCQKIQTPVYSLLFLFASLLGIYGVLPMRRIQEKTAFAKPEQQHDNSGELSEMLREAGIAIDTPRAAGTTAITSESPLRKLFKPFKEKNYRNLIKFLSIYDFSINLAIPFLTVYMLNTLHYSMGLVSAITIISQVANYLCLPTWGRIADRFSNKSVLMIAGPIQLFCIFAWGCLVLPGNTTATLPLVIGIQLLLGVGTAGVALANGNIAMKLSPSDKGASHMACTNMMAALASGAAPLVTGWVCQVMGNKSGSAFPLLQDSYWYLLFGMACVLGLIALFQLEKVEEEGSVSKRQLLKSLLIEPSRRLQRQSIM